MLRREADLDADEPFMPLVLGVVSVVRRLDALLALVGPEPGGPGPRGSAEDRATLDLLLGVIAVHRRLEATFAAVDEGLTPPCAAQGPPSRPGRLELRR